MDTIALKKIPDLSLFKILSGPSWLVQCVRLSAVTCLFLLACEKEDDLVEPVPEGPIIADTSCSYLVQYESLDEVSVATIKLTTQLAGYPQFADYMKYSIKLYKIVYHTTYKGSPILASGVIAFPQTIFDSIPTMIVGNGLIFADRDTPSEFDLPDNFTGFEFIASLGYLTLIPDMIGFGVSRDILFPIHNYVHSANTMIDFIYAGEEFVRSMKLEVNKRKLMTGYSQGAYIAMATLKMIEERPVTDIKIEATAVGAGGFNLVNLLNHAVENNTYSAPSHLAVLLSSFNAIYEWNRPLTDFFQEPYAGKIPTLLNGQYDREQIDAQLTYSFDALLNPVFLNGLKTQEETDFISALQANNVDDWKPTSPLRIIHSINDDRIPVSDSEDTYHKMVANGSTSVTFTAIETTGHIESGVAFIEIVMNWFGLL